MKLMCLLLEWVAGRSSHKHVSMCMLQATLRACPPSFRAPCAVPQVSVGINKLAQQTGALVVPLDNLQVRLAGQGMAGVRLGAGCGACRDGMLWTRVVLNG